MGGIGSGRHTGMRGRLAGVGNTPEHTEAMRAGMLAAIALKQSAPDVCDECGRAPDRSLPGGGALDWFQRRWLCGSCLSDEMDPLRIEDFAWSGSSNLGDAGDDHGISNHSFGPFGDQALSTEKTRAARERKRRSA